MYFSFFAQVITLFIGISAQFKTISPKFVILKHALFLENFVQFIEGTFYLWFIIYYINNVDKTDIAKYRYYDWFLTTPTMILSAIAYFQFNNLRYEKVNEDYTLFKIIQNNIYKLSEIFTYNFGMLFAGFLQEINVINIFYSTIIGFIFFALMFYKIYIYFAYKSSKNYLVFYLMLVIWSIYGIAALFEYKIKNAFYNVLDLFSKNFYGLFLSYIIFTI